MPRIAIDFFTRRAEAAYRTDPFHALRKNLESVRPEEWNVRPADHSVEEFGRDPELSICDLALHVGGPRYMYANRAFGDGTMQWGEVPGPASLDMEGLLAYLDAGHQLILDGLRGLADDSELQNQRLAPWNTPLTVEQLVGIVVNHDVYHSGEINRQRALIRGANGWQR